MLKPGPLPRGICAKCGRDVPVCKYGTLREHKNVVGRKCDERRASWKPAGAPLTPQEERARAKAEGRS